MKRILLVMCQTIGFSQISTAQVQYGLKAGINYNNNGNLTLSNVVNDAVEGADAKSGYHIGFWVRAKVPVLGVYIRPEFVYTQVKSQYSYKSTNTSYNFKKIDIPVLFGKKSFWIWYSFYWTILSIYFKFRLWPEQCFRSEYL